jgi:hypothetical protein
MCRKGNFSGKVERRLPRLARIISSSAKGGICGPYKKDKKGDLVHKALFLIIVKLTPPPLDRSWVSLKWLELVLKAVGGYQRPLI